MPLIDKICKCGKIFEVWETTMEKCYNKKHKCPKCKKVSKHKRFYTDFKYIKKWNTVPGYEKNPHTGEFDGSSLGARLDAKKSKWV